LGRELILRHKYAVLFAPTFKLVQQLLVAKRELRLEELLRKLDRFDIVILDDLGYVKQDREEMEVLFTFLAERYERRSVMLSSNLVFSKWDQIFKAPMPTMAAIDRLVHHAIILEFNGESLRAPRGKEKDKGGGCPGAPASPFGCAASLSPGGAKDSAPPKGLAQKGEGPTK
jgi:DNA replication protein DnaC